MALGIFGEKVREGQITNAHLAMSGNVMAPDARNVAILKGISEAYKELEQKMFEHNPVMRLLISSQVDVTNVFEYPVCGKCETVALWNDRKFNKETLEYDRTCGCMRCGAFTTRPPTVRMWLKDELKRRVGPDYLDMIDIGIDRIALSMMKTYINNLAVGIEQTNGYTEDGVEVDHEKIL